MSALWNWKNGKNGIPAAVGKLGSLPTGQLLPLTIPAVTNFLITQFNKRRSAGSWNPLFILFGSFVQTIRKNLAKMSQLFVSIAPFTSSNYLNNSTMKERELNILSPITRSSAAPGWIHIS